MYLHLGNDIVVRMKNVIGIFDMETSTIGKSTRSYLARAEKLGRVINVSMEMPKSFIVCREKDNKIIVYISQISTATLNKRVSYINTAKIKR